MVLKDPSQAPSLWGSRSTPDTPDTPDNAQVRVGVGGVRGVSGSDTPTPAVPRSDPVPPEPDAPTEAVAVVEEDQAPVKVGPGLGERLGVWAKESFTPPEIWSQDRPSLAKQFTYAQKGAWGPQKGWRRKAALVAFWAVSLPTSAAAYGLEWVGERPSRWLVALVLLSLTYQIPYVPEVLGVLVRIPAWPLTTTWSALGLTHT